MHVGGNVPCKEKYWPYVSKFPTYPDFFIGVEAIYCIGFFCVIKQPAEWSVNGTGFASGYRLQPRAGFKDSMGRCMVTTPSSLTSNL